MVLLYFLLSLLVKSGGGAFGITTGLSCRVFLGGHHTGVVVIKIGGLVLSIVPVGTIAEGFLGGLFGARSMDNLGPIP